MAAIAVLHPYIAPACRWAQIPTYLSRAHVMLLPSFGTFVVAKPPRLSPVTSPISTPSSMLSLFLHSLKPNVPFQGSSQMEMRLPRARTMRRVACLIFAPIGS